MANQAPVYMIVGTAHYQADSAINLAKNLSLSLNQDSFICVSASDRTSIYSGLETWRKSKLENGFSRLLLLRDLHKLDESNIKNLDFIFEVTDSYRRVRAMTVMLMSDYFDDNDSTEWTQNEWRDHVMTRFHSTEKRFNGVAFTGRIRKFLIASRQSNKEDFVAAEPSSSVCNRFHTIIDKSQKEKTLTTASTGVKFSIDVVYSILALMLIPVLYCNWIILLKRLA